MNEYEKLKKERESNYFRLAIGIILVIIFLLGNKDLTEKEHQNVQLVPPSVSEFEQFQESLITYIMDVNKTGFRGTHQDIPNLVAGINNKQFELSRFRQEERQLQSLIDAVPTTHYVHNKLDLSSFMVKELESNGLNYSINYNPTFNAESVESVEGEVEEGSEVVSSIDFGNTQATDAFSIKVFRVDESDNYYRLMEVLDRVFIKEPYEILRVNMAYDEVTEGYFYEFTIGI